MREVSGVASGVSDRKRPKSEALPPARLGPVPVSCSPYEMTGLPGPIMYVYVQILPASSNHSSEPRRTRPETGATSKSLTSAASSTSPESSKVTSKEAVVPAGKSLSTVVNEPLDPETVPSKVAWTGTAEANWGTVHATAAMSSGTTFFIANSSGDTRLEY